MSVCNESASLGCRASVLTQGGSIKGMPRIFHWGKIEGSKAESAWGRVLGEGQQPPSPPTGPD